MLERYVIYNKNIKTHFSFKLSHDVRTAYKNLGEIFYLKKNYCDYGYVKIGEKLDMLVFL